MSGFDSIAGIYNLMAFFSCSHLKIKNKIEEIAQPKSTDVVLDIGGGTGLVAKSIASRVQRLVVLDPSSKMLAKIKNTNIEKVQATAQKIPFKKRSFDLVYCVDSFHHFTNEFPQTAWGKTTKMAVKEIMRVLKDDGLLIIVEFDPRTFGGKWIRFVENKLMRWGSNFYTPSSLLELFPNTKGVVQTINRHTYVASIKKK